MCKYACWAAWPIDHPSGEEHSSLIAARKDNVSDRVGGVTWPPNGPLSLTRRIVRSCFAAIAFSRRLSFFVKWRQLNRSYFSAHVGLLYGLSPFGRKASPTPFIASWIWSAPVVRFPTAPRMAYPPSNRSAHRAMIPPNLISSAPSPQLFRCKWSTSLCNQKGGTGEGLR